MRLGRSETWISLGNPTYCDRKVKSKTEAGKFTNTCQHDQGIDVLLASLVM